MPAMNSKEATGVRARSDLSANARPDIEPDGSRLSDEQLTRCADWLMQHVKEAESRKSSHVFIPVQYSRRVVDAILEVVNRGSQP